MTADWSTYIEIGGLIFSSGVFYAGVRLMRKDLTGVRRIVNENEKRRRRFNTRLLNTLRTALPEEHRERIIEMLPDDDE